MQAQQTIERPCALCRRVYAVGTTENYSTFCNDCWNDPDCWSKLAAVDAPEFGPCDQCHAPLNDEHHCDNPRCECN